MPLPSALGRLLNELSWEGDPCRYRHGGLGLENVLTVEVFQALDFLPRAEFLGPIIRSAAGGSPATLQLLAEQVEDLSFSLLPGEVRLAEGATNGKSRLTLQPDAILESPSVYCMVEAKRIKRGSFQEEQLAREFLAVLKKAGDRKGLLFLILPAPPPVCVKRHGRMALHDAVVRWLPQVLERAEGEFPAFNELESTIDSILAYTTWRRVYDEVERALNNFSSATPSVCGSVRRLANAVLDSVRRHGPLESLPSQNR